MVLFVLPNVFVISGKCNEEEFTQYILPYLKPVLKMQEPIQILLICMQTMELLLKLTLAENVKLDVLPMLFRSLECNSQQLPELCLSVIPTFATSLDISSTKFTDGLDSVVALSKMNEDLHDLFSIKSDSMPQSSKKPLKQNFKSAEETTRATANGAYHFAHASRYYTIRKYAKRSYRLLNRRQLKGDER